MKKGYFLLEAMIATLILGLAVSSILSSLGAANKIIQGTKNQSKTLILAEELLESIRYLWVRNPPWTTPWFALNAATTPPLRDSTFASAAYRITRADADARGPIIDNASNSLYFVDLWIIPKNEPENGASFTIILGKRGP